MAAAVVSDVQKLSDEPLQKLAMRRDWFKLLDPRRSLTARMAIGTVLAGLLVIGVAQAFAIGYGRHAVEQELGMVHAEYAQRLADEMDTIISTRLQNIQFIADLMDSERSSLTERRKLLESLQRLFPEFVWIGMIDPGGTVSVSTRAVLEGRQAPHDVWAGHMPSGPQITGVHFSASLAHTLGLEETAASATFIGLVVPVRDRNGQTVGLLNAQLGWSWVSALEVQLLRQLHARRPVESLIAATDGRVLLGPPDLLGAILDVNTVTQPGTNIGYQLVKWPDGNSYLTSHARGVPERGLISMGWTVFVREHAETAYADANQLQARLALIGVGASLLFACAIAVVVHRISRPINAIARAAERIQAGTVELHDLPVYHGLDEVARVSQSLNSLVSRLDLRNRELGALNLTLEQRVTDRTHQIERMGEENKQAAIVRERLRLARDLHDTLAHTLANVLTQIRLSRKLMNYDLRKAAAELDQADWAVRQGLRDARAAITNLRNSPVSDLGLLDAMRQSAVAFEITHGVQCKFDFDASLPDLANEDAEPLHRIFEEALHNVAQHAHATVVCVTLRRDGPDNRIAMTVTDDGIGFDMSQTMEGHFGLRGVWEQAGLIRADADISSKPGAGTRLRVVLPSDY